MKIKMHIGTTSITGDYDYMEKLFFVNHQFKDTYIKIRHHKHSRATITGVIIVPISVYEEEGKDQKKL